MTGSCLLDWATEKQEEEDWQQITGQSRVRNAVAVAVTWSCSFLSPVECRMLKVECRMPRGALRWTARATWIGFRFGSLRFDSIRFGLGHLGTCTWSRLPLVGATQWIPADVSCSTARQTIGDSLSGGLTWRSSSGRELNCNKHGDGSLTATCLFLQGLRLQAISEHLNRL